MDWSKYPYVVKLVCDDRNYYYNSGNHVLAGFPGDATRYGNCETDSIKADAKYVEHMGGVSSIVLYEDEIMEYRRTHKEEY